MLAHFFSPLDDDLYNRITRVFDFFTKRNETHFARQAELDTLLPSLSHISFEIMANDLLATADASAFRDA